MRAAIERHAEACRVSDAAAADVIGRLDHEIAPPGCSQSPCRRNSGGAGPDNDRIQRAARRRDRGKCRTRSERGRGRKQRTAAQRRHTLHYACGWCLDLVGSPHMRAQFASTAVAGQMFQPDLDRALVPRTRNSHKLAEGPDANFGFKSGTTGLELLVSLSIPKFVRARPMLTNF